MITIILVRTTNKHATALRKRTKSIICNECTIKIVITRCVLFKSTISYNVRKLYGWKVISYLPLYQSSNLYAISIITIINAADEIMAIRNMTHIIRITITSIIIILSYEVSLVDMQEAVGFRSVGIQ